MAIETDVIESESSLIDNSFYELAAFHDIVSRAFPGSKGFGLNIDKLHKYLSNPSMHIKELIRLSNYYYYQNGVVTDCYDTMKSLPILNYSIMFKNMSNDGFVKAKIKVENFIKKIKPKQLARDTIFQVLNEGTCVWYNRDNKYIQFLDSDQYKIEFMVNGKWQVFYDLHYIYSYKYNWTTPELLEFIRSLPDEVTLDDYIRYTKKREDRSLRYVPLDIEKTQVFKFRGGRNDPFGIPYAIPALSSIIHKDLLEKTERAVADRVLNQIIVQKVNSIPDARGTGVFPAPSKVIDDAHENLKNLLQGRRNSEQSTAAPLTVPGFIEIEALKVNLTDSIFPKETYERIERDIFYKLGYSQSISSGGGEHQTYGSATINSHKINSFIFNIIEQIEEAINEYLNNIVKEDGFDPKIWFGRATYLNQDDEIKRAESLYLKGRGPLKDFVEASGRDWEYYYAQARYENEVLKVSEVLPVNATSFTHTEKEGTKPKSDGKNENTDQSRTNNGNNTPSPSDE